MNWDVLIPIVATLGGWESLRYTFEAIRNRRTNKRKEASGATSMELDNRSKEAEILANHNRYLEQQLQERNLRVDAQYKKIEVLIEQNTLLLIEAGQKDVALNAAENARCNVNGCTNRQPPRRYAVKNYNKPKKTEQ